MDHNIGQLHQDIFNTDTIHVSYFGPSLIIAPHPDDETLGCGGTIALLCKENIEVHFIFVSDGSMSHPNSTKYPAPKLTALRENEAICAVTILGGDTENIEFLRLKDTLVPRENDPQFQDVVNDMVERINRVNPQTIFLPWQNDPHHDHRATWQIVKTAVDSLPNKPTLMQYPIWLWEMGNPEDAITLQKMKKRCVNIEETKHVKMKALEAHESQVTNLIDDDPQGFTLSEQVIAHFDIDREIFFEL